jgi:hypothetical protein
MSSLLTARRVTQRYDSFMQFGKLKQASQKSLMIMVLDWTSETRQKQGW